MSLLWSPKKGGLMWRRPKMLIALQFVRPLRLDVVPTWNKTLQGGGKGGQPSPLIWHIYLVRGYLVAGREVGNCKPTFEKWFELFWGGEGGLEKWRKIQYPKMYPANELCL